MSEALYGLWVSGENVKEVPARWWYHDYVVWFTPDIRIACAQRHMMMTPHSWCNYSSILVCRLGQNGEPINVATSTEKEVT